ncbi:hypothetical protein G6F35_017328 [Rhizopus arrhizus]|nr:hypothetical protein G6F35_017328 [Rhizopus arrhizus]
MQVAVTDVAEPDHVELRIGMPDQRLGLGQERRHRRDPHRDIVLVRFVACKRLGDALAQAPQLGGLGVTCTDHAIADPAVAHAVLERRHRRRFLRVVVGRELGDHNSKACS